MRLLLRILSAAVLALAAPRMVQAGSGADCKHDALIHLQASSPEGFATYRQISDKSFFRNWISCDDAQFDLSTAVHESTHFITGETDAFPLIGGGAVPRPHEVTGFFPPSRIVRQFKPGGLVDTYLRPGTSSSATDFLYLLDELNAYAHGLAAAVDLERLSRPDEAVDHRDGLAAMMAFVATYAETAEDSDPATWAGLRQPPASTTVAALWRQGEHVLASACGIPNFGAVDKLYIRRFCTARARAALEPILGRAPVCPTACLTDEPETLVADEEGSEPRAALPSPRTAAAAAVAPPEPVSWFDRFVHGLTGSPDSAGAR